MLDVVVADGGGKLGLECDDPPIAALNDQVDLMVAPVSYLAADRMSDFSGPKSSRRPCE